MTPNLEADPASPLSWRLKFCYFGIYLYKIANVSTLLRSEPRPALNVGCLNIVTHDGEPG